MNIPAEVGLLLGSGLLSGGVAFGVLKGSMENYVRHDTHRQICHSKSEETNAKIDTLFDRLGETTTKIDTLTGYVKGVMERQLK